MITERILVSRPDQSEDAQQDMPGISKIDVNKSIERLCEVGYTPFAIYQEDSGNTRSTRPKLSPLDNTKGTIKAPLTVSRH